MTSCMDNRVRSLEEAESHITSLTHRVEELERMVSDHSQRFDTIQTPLWLKIIFRLDGWPTTDLNADKPAWRPWRKWWTS